MLTDAGLKEGEKFAVFSVRKWKKLTVDFDDKFAEMADYISEKHGLTPVFVPLHYPYDASVSRNIISKMKNRALFITGRIDTPTTLSLVEKSELNVSVRLHSLIYAACAGVPSIGIAYDPKVPGFQQSVNQPFINPEDFKPEVYQPMIDNCIENREELSQTILQSATQLKEKAKLTASLANEMMR